MDSIHQAAFAGWFEFPVCKPFFLSGFFSNLPRFFNELRKE